MVTVVRQITSVTLRQYFDHFSTQSITVVEISYILNQQHGVAMLVTNDTMSTSYDAITDTQAWICSQVAAECLISEVYRFILIPTSFQSQMKKVMIVAREGLFVATGTTHSMSTQHMTTGVSAIDFLTTLEASTLSVFVSTTSASITSDVNTKTFVYVVNNAMATPIVIVSHDLNVWKQVSPVINICNTPIVTSTYY
jgi:hypothetical protein